MQKSQNTSLKILKISARNDKGNTCMFLTMQHFNAVIVFPFFRVLQYSGVPLNFKPVQSSVKTRG